MIKQFIIVSSIVLTAVIALQPYKPEPIKMAAVIGDTKFNSVYNEETGQWDVTWHSRYATTAPNLPYYLSVSITKVLFNIRL